MDRFGTRLGYTGMIVFWSAANALMGTVSSVFGLGVCRLLLGMGEGGGFPGSAKAVAEWFPREERATAFGIFNTGSAVGAIAAPPLLALIVARLGWRWVAPLRLDGRVDLPPLSSPVPTYEERATLTRVS